MVRAEETLTDNRPIETVISSELTQNQNYTNVQLETLRNRYISSILTANMVLLTLLVILLIQLSVLLVIIAVKARNFLSKVVAEGVVIDDVRPFTAPEPNTFCNLVTPPPPAKPKRSKYGERLVE